MFDFENLQIDDQAHLRQNFFARLSLVAGLRSLRRQSLVTIDNCKSPHLHY